MYISSRGNHVESETLFKVTDGGTEMHKRYCSMSILYLIIQIDTNCLSTLIRIESVTDTSTMQTKGDYVTSVRGRVIAGSGNVRSF